MSADLGSVMLGVTNGINAFTVFLPKLSDVRKAGNADPDVIGDVRMGEVAAVTLTMGIGAISSMMTQSSLPTYIALLVCVVLVFLYEAALRGDRPFSPKNVGGFDATE